MNEFSICSCITPKKRETKIDRLFRKVITLIEEPAHHLIIN